MSINNQIVFSIIIPHYNIPELLIRLLKTIPDDKHIQVLVVDDASTTNLQQLLSYINSRNNVEIFYSSHNMGGGHARNIGLQNSRGKWLIFADADDLFPNDFYEIIMSNSLSKSDILYFNVTSVYSNDLSKNAHREIYRNQQFQLYKSNNDDKILRYRTVEVWGKMFKKQLIDKHRIQFDETPVANDYSFSVKCGYYAQNINLIDRVLYVITERPGSVSSNGWASSKEKLLVRLDVALRVQIFLAQKNIFLIPMPIRGLMVVLLKNWPLLFLKKIFYLISIKEISVVKLFYQMFTVK